MHFHKKGKGLVNCVYKKCPTAPYGVVPIMLQYLVTSHIMSLFKSIGGVGQAHVYKISLLQSWTMNPIEPRQTSMLYMSAYLFNLCKSP